MAWNDIPRTNSFSLGDFHDFDRCIFRFFVNHHLQKKYELAEGSPAQTTGSLLDLAIKKLHISKAYNLPADYLQNLIKAAEVEMREDVAKRGKNSFYGAQVEFLTPDVIEKAKEIFKSYCQSLSGQFKKLVATEISRRPKPFWTRVINGNTVLQLWGAPDAIEMGADGIPEIVDYKYFEDVEKGKGNLDMDLMPKIYTLLCAEDLQKSGFGKARFVARLWQEPHNGDYYEEFSLSVAQNLEDFFRDKMEKILRTKELTFCEKDYCKACSHPDREKWIKELQANNWIAG